MNPEVAQARIARLGNQDQDILGLLTLGLKIADIADRVFYGTSLVKSHLSTTIYPAIAANGSFKRAREVAWTAGLLEQAWATNVLEQARVPDDHTRLSATRTLLQEYSLGIEYIWVMIDYRLVLKDLEIMRLVTQGLQNKQIATLKHKKLQTIKEDRAKICAELGTKNKRQLIKVLTNLGRTATEPQPFFW